MHPAPHTPHFTPLAPLSQGSPPKFSFVASRDPVRPAHVRSPFSCVRWNAHAAADVDLHRQWLVGWIGLLAVADRYPCDIYTFTLPHEGAIEVALTWERHPRAPPCSTPAPLAGAATTDSAVGLPDRSSRLQPVASMTRQTGGTLHQRVPTVGRYPGAPVRAVGVLPVRMVLLDSVWSVRTRLPAAGIAVRPNSEPEVQVSNRRSMPSGRNDAHEARPAYRPECVAQRGR